MFEKISEGYNLGKTIGKRAMSGGALSVALIGAVVAILVVSYLMAPMATAASSANASLYSNSFTDASTLWRNVPLFLVMGVIIGVIAVTIGVSLKSLSM